MSDERTPFWKKDVSLGRKLDAGEPRSPLDTELDAIKQAAMGAAPPTAAAEPAAEARPTQMHPFGLTTIADEEWEEPKARTPFWKKEIGGGKKQKAPKQEQAKPAKALESQPAKVDELDPDAPLGEKPVKVPFWKKEIGGKKKQPSEPEAARAAKPPRADGGRPFWRKQIAIGTRSTSAKGADAPKEKPDAKRKKSFSLPKLEARPRRVKRDKSGRVLPQKHKRIVGLKIGASQIAAARLSNNGAAELMQVARQDLEPGIVVGGELREPELLAELLRDFFKRNGLPRRGVRLGIANNRIGVRTFEVAGIDDPKQLDNAIRFRAQEALPIPIEDAVLDYQILGEDTDAEGQPVKRVLLVVAYRELVDRYVSACSKAGIELVGIDLEAFALLRAMSPPRPEGDEAGAAVVVVSIGHERSTFAVSDGRVCEFARVLEWGGSALNVAIAREINKAPSEAEPYKRALDLNMMAPPPELTQEQFDAVKEAVRRQVQAFARELVSSLQFYQNQPGSLGIGEIVLTGGTAHLSGLAEELQRLIGVHVRIGDPLARVRVGKKVADDDQVGSLAVAIGLGIED